MVVQYEFVRNESVDLVFNNVLIYHPNYGWHLIFGGYPSTDTKSFICSANTYNICRWWYN